WSIRPRQPSSSAFAKAKLSACPCIVVRRWAIWLKSSGRSTRESRWLFMAQSILPTAPPLFPTVRNHEYAFNSFTKIYATVVSVRRRHDARVRCQHLRGEPWSELQPVDSSPDD